MTIHAFAQSLERSRMHTDAAWWEEVYRKAWPNFLMMGSIGEDGWSQRSGVDRVVTLKSGRSILIDEKVREKDWGDILIELWSMVPKDGRKPTPGWACKPLNCEFIAYAIAPTKTCYLLPTLTLQRAVRVNGKAWVGLAGDNAEGFAIKRADNGWYFTENLAVPLPRLLTALGDAMTVRWGDA